MIRKELSENGFIKISFIIPNNAQQLCEHFRITHENTNPIFFYVLDKMIEDFEYVFQITQKHIPKHIILTYIFHTCIDIYCSNFWPNYISPTSNINSFFPEKRIITLKNQWNTENTIENDIIEAMKATTPAKIAKTIFRAFGDIMYEEEKAKDITSLRPLPKGRPTKKENRFSSFSNVELIEYYKKTINQHQEIKIHTSTPLKNTINVFKYNKLLAELVSELETRGYNVEKIYKSVNTQEIIENSIKRYYFDIRQKRKNIPKEELYRVAKYFKILRDIYLPRKIKAQNIKRTYNHENPFKINRGTLDAATIRVWHELAPQSKVKTVNTPSSEWGVKALWKLAGIEPTTGNRYRR